MTPDPTSLSARYGAAFIATIEEVRATQWDAISLAGGRCFDVIRSGGIVYAYGSGHSAHVAADLTCRAGGLVPVECIYEPSLVSPPHGQKASLLERVDGIGKAVFEGWSPTAGDCAIVVSNSGRNDAVVGFAEAARAAGVPVIAVTSIAHSQRYGPANRFARCLWECADIVIDTRVPAGDALLDDVFAGWSAGPASTAISSFITQSIVLEVVDRYLVAGLRPPVLMSANVPDGARWNASVLEGWKGRIHAL